MNDDPTNLDRLHDIVLPAPVPWWPPAPGWYVVFAIILCGVVACVVLCLRSWRANAYRRAALRELAAANSAAAVSELLRRVALVIAPRPLVASLTGPDWPQWLADRLSEPMPRSVRVQLMSGVYAQPDATAGLNELREFAAVWIARHKVLMEPDHQ